MIKLVIENQELLLEFIPECGGKIYNLISKKTGRQWLWHNPNIKLAKPEYGDSFTSLLDSGGWDEIFPSVLPCHIVQNDGLELIVPDHGDIVSLPVFIRQPDAQTLVLVTKGKCADFEFRRRISLSDNVIEFNFSVNNAGNKPFPFLWSSHPLFRYDKNMEIDFDCSVPFTVESVFGAAPFQPGDSFRWPGTNGLNNFLDHSKTDLEPFAMKFFSDVDSVSSLSLTSTDSQERLIFSWDNRFARHLGIWMNCGGWSGVGIPGDYSLGIEPTTAPTDDLAKAVDSKQAYCLKPGEQKSWAIHVALEQLSIEKTKQVSKRAKRLLS